MRSKLSRRVRVTAGLAVVGIILGSWWYFAQPNVDRSAREFAVALERSDWGVIYDMASEKEKTLQSWRKAEFVALMKEIGAKQLGKIEQVSIGGDWQRQTTSKFFVFRFRTESGKNAVAQLHFYRDYDDWHPEISSLPLMLYTGGDKPTRETAQFLYEACNKANVKTLVRLYDRVEFSNERLGRYLNGELSWFQVARLVPEP